MNKTADTQFPVLPVIAKRWSPRSFQKSMIGSEDLDSLFEAARWSASSMNAQPWRYRYAERGSAAFDQIMDCLLPGNQAWAGDASVLMVSSAITVFPHNGRPNVSAVHDVGMANAHLVLEAQSRDIYAHMIAGYNPELLNSAIQFEEDEIPICVIALGHLGRPEELQAELERRERAPRLRKTIAEFTKKLEDGSR